MGEGAEVLGAATCECVCSGSSSSSSSSSSATQDGTPGLEAAADHSSFLANALTLKRWGFKGGGGRGCTGCSAGIAAVDPGRVLQVGNAYVTLVYVPLVAGQPMVKMEG